MSAVIILAAGHGSRMNTSLPKVLQPIAGLPMLLWVINAAKAAFTPDQVIVVCSETLAKNSLLADYQIAVQNCAKGTGHALQVGYEKVMESSKDVFVLCADTPLVQASTLKQLESNTAVSLLAMQLSDLTASYGRVCCNQYNNPIQIIETKHNVEAKSIPLANAGMYRFQNSFLKNHLNKLKPNPESGEFYITDLIEIAGKTSESCAYALVHEQEALGSNTLAELEIAEKILQKRLVTEHMKSGVRFSNPESTHVSFDTEIAVDSIVEPNVFFGKNVKIGKGCIVKSFSYLEDCTFADYATIGPFARIRGGSTCGEKVDIGNFVELKNATLGDKVKAKHLAYLGDTYVGEKTNIGAGTITANYNGFEKNKISIGKQVMIGSNSTLIAPVEISDNAYIAAGSVISKNVSSYSLAITRTEQKEKTSWVNAFRQRYKK